MAENKKEVSTAAVKKVDTKLGFGGRTAKWFREMRSELKKVVWPTQKATWKNTLIVIVVLIILCIIVTILDLVFGGLRDLLAQLVG